MTSLQITEDDIPSLHGKVAVVTGGSSGIGLATVQIFADRGATVYILDLNPPPPGTITDGPVNTTTTTTAAVANGASTPITGQIKYIHTDTSSWPSLLAAFTQIGPNIDIAVANAGVSESHDFLEDRYDDATGKMLAPDTKVVDVNFRGVVFFVKLAVTWMRRRGTGGSVVLTTSATAYAPEQSLPVYSASKTALLGLLRSLRSLLSPYNITINTVAPAATLTALLPLNLATPLMAAGLPVSEARFVGRAVAFSATASQHHRVDDYGKDVAGQGQGEGKGGRWNGRTIVTLGDRYTEVEEGLASLRGGGKVGEGERWEGGWWGKENERMTRMQQSVTDFRDFGLKAEVNGDVNGVGNGVNGVNGVKTNGEKNVNGVEVALGEKEKISEEMSNGHVVA